MRALEDIDTKINYYYYQYNQGTAHEEEVSDEQSAVLTGSSSDTDSDSDLYNENDWREHEAEIPAGVTDTMLTSPDFLEDSECRHILNVAPDRLLSIFRDKYCEEMVFLTV